MAILGRAGHDAEDAGGLMAKEAGGPQGFTYLLSLASRTLAR